MHKKYFISLICLATIIIISCKTKKTDSSESSDKSFYVSQCKSYRIKTEKQITWSSVYLSTIEKPFNQVRYCTHHPDVLSQLLYDELGDWDLVYIDEENKSVIKFWFKKKIKGIDRAFNYGLTSYYDCLSSVIVYNEDDIDMLAPESDFRDVLLENFENRINNYDTSKKSSYSEKHRREITPIYRKIYN